MHEMSLASDVVDVAVKAAAAAGASRVRAIHMTIGQGRDIVEDLFEGLMQRLARGTAVEGAELVLARPPFMVRCKNCGEVYPINVFNQATWPCPACAVKDYDLHSGMEFCIDKIVVA